MVMYSDGALIDTTRPVDPYWEDTSGSLSAAWSESADSTDLWPEDAVATGVATYDWLLRFKEKCRCACPFLAPALYADRSGMGRLSYGTIMLPTSKGGAMREEAVEADLRNQYRGVRGDGKNVTDVTAIKVFGRGPGGGG